MMSSISDALKEGDGRKWDELTVEEQVEKNKDITEHIDSDLKYIKKSLDELNYKLERQVLEERQDEELRRKFQDIERRVRRNENNIKQLHKQLKLKQYY